MHAAPPTISSHTFADNIAAEKAKLEEQLASVKPGPQMEPSSKRSGS
jgi:hypothetical protein